LREHHDLYILHDDSIVHPWLLEEVNDPNPVNRFGAALHLARRYGDSTFVLSAARELIRHVEDSVAIREDAIDMLVYQDPVPASDVQLLVNSVNLDRNPWFRKYAFAALLAIARRGNDDAVRAIEAIRDTCPWMEYRERAHYFLKKMGSQTQK